MMKIPVIIKDPIPIEPNYVLDGINNQIGDLIGLSGSIGYVVIDHKIRMVNLIYIYVLSK